MFLMILSVNSANLLLLLIVTLHGARERGTELLNKVWVNYRLLNIGSEERNLLFKTCNGTTQTIHLLNL
jgi:hypothetical protein